jgi:cytoskeletal protein CcmA (bactofilin family)
VDGAIWAGSGITVERNVVVEGPVVSREQVDWQGRRAQCLIAPRVLLGRPAFPLGIRGSLLCKTLVLGADACISGTLNGLLVVSGRIARRDTGQALRSLLVLADAAAEGLDVPCAVTLEDRVRIDHLCAGGTVILGEGCQAASVSGQNVVLGRGSRVSHVHARGTLVLGPGSVVQTAIAEGRITVDAAARVEGDLIASACGEVEIDGVGSHDGGWYADPRYQYRANVAALLNPAMLLEPGAVEDSMQGWAAVRYLPQPLYRQLEGLHGGWFAALRPLPAGEAM